MKWAAFARVCITVILLAMLYSGVHAEDTPRNVQAIERGYVHLGDGKFSGSENKKRIKIVREGRIKPVLRYHKLFTVPRQARNIKLKFKEVFGIDDPTIISINDTPLSKNLKNGTDLSFDVPLALIRAWANRLTITPGAVRGPDDFVIRSISLEYDKPKKDILRLSNVITLEEYDEYLRSKSRWKKGQKSFETGLNLQQSNIGNPKLAFKNFLKGAEEKHAFSQLAVGRSFLKGIGTTQDLEQGILWLKLAASQNIAGAQMDLAELYQFGLETRQHTVKPDLSLSETYWIAAAAQDSLGQFGYARFLASDPRNVADNTNVARLLRTSADGGHAKAQLALGYALQYSVPGVGRDSAGAMQLFKAARARGESDAAVHLGDMYLSGATGDLDTNKAISLYQEAASEGNIRAKSRLGEIYMDDPGKREAGVKLLREAASEGEANGLLALSKAHLVGRGVARDPKRAIELYSLADELGDMRFRRRHTLERRSKNWRHERSWKVGKFADIDTDLKTKLCNDKHIECGFTPVIFVTDRAIKKKANGDTDFEKIAFLNMKGLGKAATSDADELLSGVVYVDVMATKDKNFAEKAKKAFKGAWSFISNVTKWVSGEHTYFRVKYSSNGYANLNTVFSAFSGELKKDKFDLLLFVHGFSNSFESAARRAAKLASDLAYPGLPIIYSWPSRNWPYLFGYKRCRFLLCAHLRVCEYDPHRHARQLLFQQSR